MERKIISAVEIDGKPISPISSLIVHQPLNGHHSFEVRCPLSEKEKSLSDAGSANVGKEIKIDLASKNSKSTFTGLVTGVSLSKHQGTAMEIVYHGYSPTILMDDGQHCQSFEEKTLDKIAKEVCGKFGVSLNADPAYKNPLHYFVQYRETAFSFLSRLASLYGEWFFYDGSGLCFGKAPKPSPVELIFGRDLYSFDLGLNVAPIKFKQLGYDHIGHQFPESASSAASVTELDDYGKIASGASEQIFKNEPFSPTPLDIQDKSDLDELTKHQKTAKAANMVVFQGTSDNNLLTIGGLITVKGKIGDIGNAIGKEVTYGEYRIIKISHSADSLGNYQNSFKAIPASLVEPPTNPQVVHPVCEIQPADVMENHDPEKLGRVRLQLRWQQAGGEKTPWVRVAASGAGGTHGAFFMPEKGDQVLVAFEHNNPNKPYVVGTLYHGKAKPGGDLSNPDNNKKIIKTKSGNQIAISDEGGKESIKIESQSNVITLTMEGDTKISISTQGNMSLSANNIVLSANENIVLSAGKVVTAQAGDKEKLTLTKGESAKLEGKDTSMTGEMKAVVHSKTTSVEGDTTVDVKGGVINLN
ncbi:MAG: hypothetical protein IPN76_26385 [Saprospiraceae bacterium]|nr:hypothetical protein [Saprospiraceae bacterium]